MTIHEAVPRVIRCVRHPRLRSGHPLRCAACLVVVLAASLAARAQPSASDENRRVEDAATVLSELATTPDKAIPRAVLERAQGIAIFPGVKKAGFVVGGQYGRGVISVRDANNAWSAPAFLRLAGGSFGAQIGAQEVDLVLVVMNTRGVQNLLRNEFKIGGEASAAAGPVGREASASTDIQMRAEILSYSRGRGLFAGISLNGASIAEDRDANERFYGEPLTSQEVVSGKVATVPAAAKILGERLSGTVPSRPHGN
jgi:lipid-binding SYLF domain-containing protein